MSGMPGSRPIASRRFFALAFFAALLSISVAWGRPGPSAAATAGGQLVAEPVLSTTAAGVEQLFGASPLEAPGEVWGVGTASRERTSFVRYTEATGWERVADPVDSKGQPVPLSSRSIPRIALAGDATPSGGVATLASVGAGAGEKILIVRDPGGQLRAVPAPEAPILEAKEELFAENFVKLAAVDEAGGGTGVFVVPSPGAGTNASVLHYDGSDWARERICLMSVPPDCKGLTGGFNVLAIDAAGPGDDAWLLARQTNLQERGGRVVLLRREAESGEWREQPLGGAPGTFLSKEESKPAPGVVVRTTPRERGQSLTVTSEGIWFDATVCVGASAGEKNGNLCSGGTKSDATFYYDADEAAITGSWCDLAGSAAAICTAPLGSDLSSGEGRSFAWPPGPGEQFGTRAITGVGQGAMLIFEGGGFARIPLAGNGGGSAGAALSAPDQGWLGPSYRLTRVPVPSGLQPWPVPFRRPLTAIAPEPGAPVAALDSQALAVGDRGQIARYLSGQGWQPEPLLSGDGKRATPDLRAVAWPRPSLAFAVGDEGAMWLWRASTGLWEPDPGAPPSLIRGNFTGIAFDPADPVRGYAVGKQGLLLRYGRRWTQEPLPSGVNPEVNITSIAFAGREALATYSLVVPAPGPSIAYVGGLLVNDGSGWRVDVEAPKVLEEAERGSGTVAPRRVAGLPDGGAVVVGATGGVIAREAPGAPWREISGTPLGYPVAVAAIREGGELRVLLSVEGNPIGGSTFLGERSTDEAQAAPPAGAPLLTHPYPLPKNGFLVRQTANGWRDEQRQSYGAPAGLVQGQAFDLPRVPDAVLALLISPDGSSGWAVGGNTGEIANADFGPFMREGLQSGTALRYGSDAAPPANASTVPISIPGDQATFAIGGGAACASPCADLAGTGIGPDVWLRAGIGTAATMRPQGLRAFLYTGSSVADSAAGLGRAAFGEEEAAYARRLGSNAGPLPVYAAPSGTDRFESSLAAFGASFAGFPAPLGTASPPPDIAPLASGDRAKGNYSYAFDSSGPGGPVRVIVLDYSVAPLSTESQCWLADQLAGAKAASPPRPAIVVGNQPAGGDAPLRQLLVTGANASCQPLSPASASAYFFKADRNLKATLSWGKASIPTFGTGTLGYTPIPQTARNQYVPASGFLLAFVDAEARDGATNIAPVSTDLIPSIGSLAIDALDGTLLRRSQPALFQALARRPNAGISCAGNFAPKLCDNVSPDAYVQIPARCINSPTCSSEILPRYSFTSSRPDIADFVRVDPLSTNARAVFLNASGRPVPDSSSGLLCAFNAGTTTVTVQAGDLAYSSQVTVQKGSVQRPCGTVPLTGLAPAQPQIPAPVAPLPTSSSPTFTSGTDSLPPPPPPGQSPISPPAAHTPLPQPPVAPTFFTPAPVLTPVIAIVPPPPPPAVQTTPPSGTSPVTQPAFSPEPEEEEEAAFDVAHHMVAVRPSLARPALLEPARGNGGPSLVLYLPILILLAAVAGATLAGPRRRPSQFAYAVQTTPRRPQQ
ncbi:MAG TPA: hypothetical protein VFI03_03190 [Solirubrobacterales bacterium]|nr:hypothetical protein [Solirubrobacterales bacterium]